MRNYKIFFNELSPITETGNRNEIQHKLIGIFDSVGMAWLVLKLLNENTYKNTVNRDKAGEHDHMIYLSVEQ